jgi:hypothetical protein
MSVTCANVSGYAAVGAGPKSSCSGLRSSRPTQRKAAQPATLITMSGSSNVAVKCECILDRSFCSPAHS